VRRDKGEGRADPSGDATSDGADGVPDRARVDPVGVEWLARAAIARLAAEAALRAGPEPAALSDHVVEHFSELLAAGDYAAAEAVLHRLTGQRQDYARIADGLLSRAARRLGQRWEEDSLSFADVSVAVAQIFRLNQAFRQRHVPIRRGAARLGLFATLPGQPHNLGLVLAAEAFRGQGWDVELRLDTPSREIVELAQRHRPSLIGLTISREDKRHQLAHLILTLRALPVPFRIMLGGRGAVAIARVLPPGQVDRVVSDIASALREA
jgi:methanogenic corrinoid protein MtbC1